ncbi:Rgg/GadR/MutR family transcriptional regulator [Rummeliibacillus sp. TYF005]|uniref:helix-turn-helix domain-containing protein n=1 Tax=Rummeliibacillus sp. TYF005 TaxID=2058214 RepID=UPI000F52365C|nr:Rgg/GadR/MutR family transcriptional regulator [Rummeliibacillus sp. TYF005]RPJ94073.1 Rgg/GadR/MutR family transcriptional regulator [Rummeliibacillus sp. TYF005]
MEIGQVIKKIRTNKNITQQSLANAIGMTRPYIARIESGKNSISSDKLTEILDYCNVTYNEFFYMKNDYKKESKMNAYNDVIKLFYDKKIEEISKIKKEAEKKYKENGDIFLRHLYILCHCMENNLDVDKINKDYIQEMADYLLSIDDWCYHELVVLNNFLFIFPPATALLMSKNLLKYAEKYKELNSDTKVLSYLIFNLLELSIKNNDIESARMLLSATKAYTIKNTEFFELTLSLFYEGMLNIIDDLILEGIEKCNKSLDIFNTLGNEYFYTKLKEDLDNLLKKKLASNKKDNV